MIPAPSDERLRNTDAERVSDIVADWWAVWSETGMHIGTWSDEAIARSVFLGQYPKGTVRHLVSADIIEAQSKALAEARAGHEAASANFHTMQNAANELRIRAERAEAEIVRMTPNFVAYEYLETPERADKAEAALAEAVETLHSLLTGKPQRQQVMAVIRRMQAATPTPENPNG